MPDRASWAPRRDVQRRKGAMRSKSFGVRDTDATSFESSWMCKPGRLQVPILPQRRNVDLFRMLPCSILLERVPVGALERAQERYRSAIYRGKERADIIIDCKNPLKSTSWSPTWIKEKRSPSFVDGDSVPPSEHSMQSTFGMGMAL